MMKVYSNNAEGIKQPNSTAKLSRATAYHLLCDVFDNGTEAENDLRLLLRRSAGCVGLEPNNFCTIVGENVCAVGEG
jgi:hypothetical protein